MSGLGICIDLFHCWAEGDVEAMVQRALPRTELIQLSDYVLGDRALPGRAVPGDGAIPLEAFIAQALAGGYAHGFDLELIGPAHRAEGRLRIRAARLRRRRRDAGQIGCVTMAFRRRLGRRGAAVGVDRVLRPAAARGRPRLQGRQPRPGRAARRRVPLPHPEPRPGLRSGAGDPRHPLPGAAHVLRPDAQARRRLRRLHLSAGLDRRAVDLPAHRHPRHRTLLQRHRAGATQRPGPGVLHEPFGDIPEANLFGHQLDDRRRRAASSSTSAGPSAGPNWLPTTPESRKLFIRQGFDRWDESPAQMRIERVDMASPKPLPTPGDDGRGDGLGRRFRHRPDGRLARVPLHLRRRRRRAPEHVSRASARPTPTTSAAGPPPTCTGSWRPTRR